MAIAAVLILGMGLDGLLAAVVDEEDEKNSDLFVTQPVSTNVPPVVEVVPDISSGKAPLHVQFEGDVYDEDGEITSLEWDFEGDGVFEVVNNLKSIERPQKLEAARQGLQKEYVYTKPGIYHAVVRVTDDKDESTTASVTIQVHSDRPWLDITPSNKDGFSYQAQAGYEAFFGEDVAQEIKFELNDSYITTLIHSLRLRHMVMVSSHCMNMTTATDLSVSIQEKMTQTSYS
ncbi:MAG: PKD domain-containing protein [Candidatus Methanofastidiosia archaeon]